MCLEPRQLKHRLLSFINSSLCSSVESLLHFIAGWFSLQYAHVLGRCCACGFTRICELFLLLVNSVSIVGISSSSIVASADVSLYPFSLVSISLCRADLSSLRSPSAFGFVRKSKQHNSVGNFFSRIGINKFPYVSDATPKDSNPRMLFSHVS